MRGVLVVVALVLAGCSLPEPQTAPVGKDPPRLLVALGDSITRAANPEASVFGDHPEVSWATGNASLVAGVSHAERLRAAGWAQEGALNYARSGARMTDLAAQAKRAVEAGADYVTILMGANDACRPSVAAMTHVETYRAEFVAAAETLKAGLPRATVFVSSLPNITALADVHENDSRAHRQWRQARVCQSLLAENATDADRAAFAARVADYNRVLEEESARFGFAWDDGAVFATRFAPEDVSDFDHFHPSIAGQARLANVTWAAGPWAGGVPAQG